MLVTGTGVQAGHNLATPRFPALFWISRLNQIEIIG
jgi:hypothetical protein